MSYKDTRVRYVPANGRHLVEILCGGEWKTIAIRERRDVALRIFETIQPIESMTDAAAEAKDQEERARLEQSASIRCPACGATGKHKCIQDY